MKQCFPEDSNFRSVITIYTDLWNGEKNWASARRKKNPTKQKTGQIFFSVNLDIQGS